MFMLQNPIVAILFNEKLNRWHPIIYYEAPLPGPDSPGKPVRHKSKGHHTEGFEKREDALAEATKIAEKIVSEELWSECKQSVAVDVQWNGEGIPADVAFFAPEPDGTMKRVM